MVELIQKKAYCVHDYRIKAEKKTCIPSLITKQDIFPTTQTRNENRIYQRLSSVDSLSETDNKVFNAMIVRNGIIGRVTPQTLFQCSSLLLIAKPVALSIGCWTGLRAKSFYSCSFLACCSDSKSPISPITVAGAVTYSCFEKGCPKKCLSARDKTKGYCGKL